MTGPALSVVIPTFRRPQELARALRGWEAQRPTDISFEVVVVDDGSGDATPEVVAAHRSSRFRLRLHCQDNAGPAAARNAGLVLASGRRVLFSGDDIEPEPDLVFQHIRGHERWHDPLVAVLGLTRWAPDQELTATMRHVDGVGAQQFSYHWMTDGAEYDFRHFYTSNVSLDRSALALEPGGFSRSFPAAAFEDAEFAYRLSRHGLRIRYHAAARAFHRHPYTVERFFERQRSCGRMATVLADLHPQLSRWSARSALLWLAAAGARLGGDDRRRAERAAGRLDELEARLLRLASVYDRTPAQPPDHDDLLLALFQFGFHRGVVDRTFSLESGNRVAALLLLRDVVPVVRRYRRGCLDRGWPLPEHDAAVVSAA